MASKHPFPVAPPAPSAAPPIEVAAQPAEAAPERHDALVRVANVTRRFGRFTALDGISLSVERHEVHALLGPNGAGKTTLLRILAGLVFATSGEVRVAGLEPGAETAVHWRQVGLVPAGDRSFYLRISGLENLVFFARLYGLRRREAVERARECLREVGLESAAKKRVGLYSHGMQKRLSVARALLVDPALLLIDEATHDLDPEGAERVRELVRERARRGAAVIWATQRLDEIRGLAQNVTLLSNGTVRFSGSVPHLLANSSSRRFVLRVEDATGNREPVEFSASDAIGDLGQVSAIEGSADSFLLTLRSDATLGRAITALGNHGLEVVACHGERSEVEDAFLSLLDEDVP